MGAIASQITSLMIVYSIVYSDVDQRKHQSSASLAFVRGIHRGPVNSPHKWPVTPKMFPFDDVIMVYHALAWTAPHHCPHRQPVRGAEWCSRDAAAASKPYTPHPCQPSRDSDVMSRESGIINLCHHHCHGDRKLHRPRGGATRHSFTGEASTQPASSIRAALPAR